MLKCGGKICYMHIVVVIVVDRIFGQFTMETILAAAFGRQVNVLKGEGDELTEAAAGMFSNTSAKFLTLMQCLYCKSSIFVICNYYRYIFSSIAFSVYYH